jgi:K+-sensing histidine kinase KdpD
MAELADQNGALLEQERDTVSRLRLLTSHKDSFIRLTAHELRTPLTSIRGFAQLLARRSDDQGDGAYPRLILERSTRMAEIIDEIVDLSRMEQDLLQLDRQATDLGELLQRVARTAIDRGGSVVVNSGPLPPVRADADRLERALVMLVEAAGRDRLPSTTVTLNATSDDGSVQIWMEVEGAVPTGGLGTIFEDMPDNGEETHRGSLAVYICRKMLEAHGGRLWLERTATGGRYGLRLPVEGTGRIPRPAPDERLTA